MLIKEKRVISLAILTLFNVSVMASLRNLPLVAEYGLSCIPYFLLVALIFLIPCALVSAELATGWPKSGGVYIWIREGLGDRWGFFAIWMQWVHNVSWFPAILSFVASTFALSFFPSLAEHKLYTLGTILILFWGMSYLNYLGVKTSTLVSSIGVVLGTILPGIFIIGLSLIWILKGEPLQIAFTWNALIPDLSSIHNFVFLTGLFLAFAGLEVSAAYAGEVQNPKRNYPLSIIMAALITFFLFFLGSLAISAVIPKEKISLVSGVMEALRIMLSNYHLTWLIPVLGISLIIGALAETNSWVMGPIKAMYTTSIHGNLPPLFQTLNKHGMPTHLLLFQAVIVSFTACAIIFSPSLSAAYWILSALSAQMYLVMYILMFIAAIRLRYTKPHVPRLYQIPHPQKGMWIVASLGLVASVIAFFIAFLPPSQIDVGNLYFFEGFLIISLLIMMGIPLLIHEFKKPEWKSAVPNLEQT
ncbi:MAG: amino acid permease [Simkaniaceae bacterium]|nr:amino acid permease [Simkaniaceae bacterium]